MSPTISKVGRTHTPKSGTAKRPGGNSPDAAAEGALKRLRTTSTVSELAIAKANSQPIELPTLEAMTFTPEARSCVAALDADKLMLSVLDVCWSQLVRGLSQETAEGQWQ